MKEACVPPPGAFWTRYSVLSKPRGGGCTAAGGWRALAREARANKAPLKMWA